MAGPLAARLASERIGEQVHTAAAMRGSAGDRISLAVGPVAAGAGAGADVWGEFGDSRQWSEALTVGGGGRCDAVSVWRPRCYRVQERDSWTLESRGVRRRSSRTTRHLEVARQ